MPTTEDLVVQIGADVTRLSQAMTRVEARLNRTKSVATRMSRVMTAAFKRVGRAVGAILGPLGRVIKMASLISGAAGIFALKYSVKSWMDYEDSLRLVEARGAGSRKQVNLLGKEIRDLAKTSSFSAQEIASGVANPMALMGFKTGDISDSMEAIVNMTRATGGELEASAKLVGSIIHQFKIPAAEATKIADTMTAVATSTRTNMEQLAEGFKNVGPLAEQVGWKFQDVAAFIGIMGNQALEGAMAGRSLRRILATLADEDAVKKIFGEGFATTDANGNMLGMIDIFKQLDAVTKNMTASERLKKFREAFDLFGMGGVAAATSGIQELDELVRKITSGDIDGAARQAADIMDDSLGGVFRKMRNMFQEIALSFGERIAPAVEIIFTKATEFMSSSKGFLDTIASMISGTAIMVERDGFMNVAMSFFSTVGDILGAQLKLFIAHYKVEAMMFINDIGSVFSWFVEKLKGWGSYFARDLAITLNPILTKEQKRGLRLDNEREARKFRGPYRPDEAHRNSMRSEAERMAGLPFARAVAAGANRRMVAGMNRLAALGESRSNKPIEAHDRRGGQGAFNDPTDGFMGGGDAVEAQQAEVSGLSGMARGSQSAYQQIIKNAREVPTVREQKETNAWLKKIHKSNEERRRRENRARRTVDDMDPETRRRAASFLPAHVFSAGGG